MRPRFFPRFLAMSLGLMPSLLFAQAPVPTAPMPLKECIQYSLQNHLKMQIAANDVKIANQRATEALSGYLPQVNGTATLDDNVKRQTTIIPAGAFSPTDLKVQFGNQYSTNAVLQADQVIYDQSLINGIKASTPNKQLASYQQEKTEEDLIYNTASAYYQVLIYKEQLKLLESNEKKIGDVLNILKVQYAKGVKQQIDVDRVQVSLNNTLSQKKLAQTNLELAMNRLKNAMGMPLDAKLSIADSLSFDKNPTFTEVTSFDIRQKPDYKIQQTNLSLYEIDLKRKRSSTIPVLSAYARYGAQSFGNDLAKSYDNWFDYSAIGLKLNVPIFAGLRRYSQIQQSQLTVYNARENLKLSEETMKLQVQNAGTSVLSAFNTLQMNRDNMNLAQSVFETSNLQYQKGQIGLTDFLNADYSYKEAQTNYLNSLVNYLVANMDLERAKGNIKNYVNTL